MDVIEVAAGLEVGISEAAEGGEILNGVVSGRGEEEEGRRYRDK